MEIKPGIEALMPYSGPHPADAPPSNGELGRLVAAAVVNHRFCDLLLASPAAALTAGYNGESFHLTPEERELVVSIRASSLPDFALQLAKDGSNGTCHKP